VYPVAPDPVDPGAGGDALATSVGVPRAGVDVSVQFPVGILRGDGEFVAVGQCVDGPAVEGGSFRSPWNG